MLRSVFFPAFISLCCWGCVENVEETLDQLVSENDIPGLNLSYILEQGDPISYSSGFANVETGIKMDPGHVMFSGSIGKTYAVAVLMQLVDEGKVNLEDRFLDYFPDNEWLQFLPNINEFTVKMLLQHTSGLPRYVLKPELYLYLEEHPDKVWTYKERLAYIFNEDAVHEAGKGWSYSDSGYLLLGMLIEKITGEYYYDVISTRILKTMRLGNTHPADKRDIKNLPQGYSKLPEMFRMPERVVEDGNYVFNPQMEWTGGGIASTTEDLVRWADNYYHAELFPDSLLHVMITPSEEGTGIEPGLSYGMGSFIYKTDHGIAYGHTGFVPGFVSLFAHYPDHNISIALQTNCDYATINMQLIDYADRFIHIILTRW